MERPVVKKLKNGLTICFVPNRNTRSVTIHLRGKAGSNYENEDEVGAAHLAEHLSVECPYKNKILEAGGQIVGVTSRDEVLFMVRVRKNDFSKALEYLFQVLNSTEFSENSFEAQKRIAVQEVKRFLNVPEKYIARISYKNLFPDDRMFKLNTGDEKDLEALNFQKVKSFKERSYVSGAFSLTVCGEISKAKVFKNCENIFKGTRNGKPKKIAALPSDELKVLNLTSDFFLQSHLKIDYYDKSKNSNERIRSDLFAKIIDNYLKKELRNNKGLVYSVSAASFTSLNYGIFSIYLATGHENLVEVARIVSLIKSSIDKIFSPASLTLAKNQLIANLEFSYDKPTSRAEFYSQNVLNGDFENTFSKELKVIKGITLKEILKHSEKILSQRPKITVLSKEHAEKLVKKIFNGLYS